jgi:hypothetical protein
MLPEMRDPEIGAGGGYTPFGKMVVGARILQSYHSTVPI